MIHQSSEGKVFSLIEELLDDLGPAATYRRFFGRALGAVRSIAGEAPIFPPIDLPMAVAAALGRPEPEACVAAAASTLLWSGADLMDDAADGELSEMWAGVSPHQIALVSTNLLATLPHLLVGRFYNENASIPAAYGQAVSRTLFTMSEGQSADLEAPRAVQTIDEYLAMVRRKSGAEFALFASTPAILAGDSRGRVAGWVRFGFAYGAMLQVFSDIVSTVAEGPRNDLYNGKRSLPVLQALTELGEAERTLLRSDLDLASHGHQDAADRVIERITDSGALHFSLERVELLKFRAVRALPVRMTDMEPAHALRRMLDACSIA